MLHLAVHEERVLVAHNAEAGVQLAQLILHRIELFCTFPLGENTAQGGTPSAAELPRMLKEIFLGRVPCESELINLNECTPCVFAVKA